VESRDSLDHLNPAQRQAVEYGVGDAGPCGPLLIIAGAGSGKTNTLAHRVAHLIAHGASPGRILLLTFTRRAAGEMTRRVDRILRGRAPEAPHGAAAITWAGTFHAVGARLLRHHAQSIGLDPSFTILDREDAADLLDFVRHELGLADQKSRFPRKATCLAIYSFAVNAQAPLSDVLARSFPWCEGWEAELTRLFSAYVEAKQRQNVLDYDDLLLYWSHTMQVPEVAALVADRFDHVLVDEYQDTNPLQAAILVGLKPKGTGLTVVGDDAQAIYSFRAAAVRNILDFPGLFQPRAAVITLEQNYRSTQPILAASNAVIEQASERFSKSLFSERISQQKPRLITVRDETEQVGYVVERILAAREAGVALKHQAVLFRTSHHSGPLEIELARRNIPFVKYGGLKFLEAAHVKDFISILRWVENPRDRVCGFRVVQLLPGIGPGTARRILAYLEATSFRLDRLEGFRAPSAAAEDWPAFVELLRLLECATAWSRQVELVRDWYAPHLDRLYEAVPARTGDLEQLVQVAGGFASRAAFLEDLTLDPPGATSDEAGPPLVDEDYLILSTIHSAKGQEWRAVYILNVVDGCIPSDMSSGTTADLDEERRLLYVAMTRAKDELHLVQPLRFYVHQQPRSGDRHVYAGRTRFISAAILQHFDRFAWSPGTGVGGGSGADPHPRVDLKTRLRDMWKTGKR
jgi:DNA helicase-2/ATP-dependent DNA helicase PcrA